MLIALVGEAEMKLSDDTVEMIIDKVPLNLLVPLEIPKERAP